MKGHTKSTIEIYRSPDKKTQVEVRFDQDSVWLSQAQMAKLFSQTKQNISLHINNCYNEEELSKKATVKYSLTVQHDVGPPAKATKWKP